MNFSIGTLLLGVTFSLAANGAGTQANMPASLPNFCSTPTHVNPDQMKHRKLGNANAHVVVEGFEKEGSNILKFKIDREKQSIKMFDLISIFGEKQYGIHRESLKPNTIDDDDDSSTYSVDNDKKCPVIRLNTQCYTFFRSSPGQYSINIKMSEQVIDTIIEKGCAVSPKPKKF